MQIVSGEEYTVKLYTVAQTHRNTNTTMGDRLSFLCCCLLNISQQNNQDTQKDIKM